MIHHYITKYEENQTLYAEAWIQLNIFGKCFCFSKKKIVISTANTNHGISNVNKMSFTKKSHYGGCEHDFNVYKMPIHGCNPKSNNNEEDPGHTKLSI